MKISAHILFLASLLLLLVACGGSGRVNDVLQSADELIFVAPDSAVAVLDSLDITDASRAQRARHALLLTKARKKAYVDIPDDSLINIAVDYYRGHGDSLEVQSLYYLGTIHNRQGKYPEALIALMEAADRAAATDDDFYLAMAYRDLAEVYASLLEYQQSARYRQLAVDGFNRIHRPLYAAWERVYLPLDLVYSGRVREAYDSIKILEIDSLILSDKNLKQIFYQIACNVCKENCDYLQSDRYFDSIVNAGVTPQSKLLSQTAIVKLHLGNLNEALPLINQSFAFAHDQSDSISAKLAMSKYQECNKNYKEAYYSLRQAMNDFLPDLNKLVTHPSTAPVSDFYHISNEDNISKRNAAEHRAITWAITALLTVLSFTLLVYLHCKNLRQKELENQILLSDIEKLNKDIISLNSKQIPESEGESAFRFPGSLLNSICEARYTLSPGEDGYYKFGRQSIKFIDNLNNPAVLADLERLVNLSNNNLMVRFREQLPTLSDNYYKVTVLTFAGFSTYSISSITKLKEGSLRNIRSKIRTAIRNSNCLDKETFLNLFSSSFE